MATISYDCKRGVYRVFWNDGLARRSRTVAKLTPGQRRPRRDPPDVVAAKLAADRAELASRSDRPADPGQTIGRFLDAYRAHYVAHRAPRSVEEFDRARSYLGSKIEAMALAHFGRAEAVGYLDRLATIGLAPRTIRLRCALLSKAWSRAMVRGELAGNPWLRLPMPEAAEPNRPSWTPEQFDRLAAASRPWLKRLLVIGVHTGLRVEELIRLRWSWVEWADGDRLGAIVVPATDAATGFTAKGRRSRRVPLHPTAHDQLATLFAHNGDDGGPILRGQAGRPIADRSSAYIALQAACGRAGLPAAGTHAMRRSMGRWATLGQGPWKGRPVPVYVVSQWLGHKDLKTTLDYLALDSSASDAWMAGSPTADD